MKKLFTIWLICWAAFAQNNPGTGSTTVPIQPGTPYYTMIPISATAAINTQTTLTIPAPPAGLYNYICSLTFTASQNATSTAIVNASTTSTNFNSFAISYSLPAAVETNYNWSQVFGQPGSGCVKSAAPQVTTTFVSQTAVAQAAFTWTATYYQAP